MYNPNTGQYEKGWRPETESAKGRWEDRIDPVTGEHSVKEHHLKTVWESCLPGECYFEITDSAKREATCTKCKMVVNFIVGIDILTDGKFSKK